jgi:hypothetical protein
MTSDTIYTLSMADLRALPDVVLERLIWEAQHPPGAMPRWGYPPVARDLNAAWGLVRGLDWTLQPGEQGADHIAIIERGTPNEYDYMCVEEVAETPARALALAWCAWWKRGDGKEE